MSAFAIIRFFLECAAAGLVCYAIYREKDLIKFERKVWKYTKAFFKALYFTLKEKVAPVKEARTAEPLVNEEFAEILASLDNAPAKIVEFPMAS